MNDTPKVSIVIPVYNVENYLEKCIKSITDQTLSDIEIICVDDGSTDRSLEIISQYANIDNRVKIINQKNKGPGVARNRGFEVVTGEYVLFMDSDDFVEPFMLKEMYLEAKEHKTDIIMCRSFEYVTQTDSFHSANWTIDDSCVPIGENFNYKDVGNKILQFSFGWTWDKLYNTDFLKNNKLSFAPLKNSEDLVLSYKALFAAKQIRIINKRMVYHRVDNYTSVSKTREKNCTCFIDSSEMLLKYIKEKCANDPETERSYVNWATNYAVWNMNTLSPLYRYKVFIKLKYGGLKRLSISSEYGKDYYFNKEDYETIREIEKMPTLAYIVRDFLRSYIECGFVQTISEILR